MRAVLEVFLVLFSVFVQQKVTVTENITFAESVSGIRSPDCSKLAKNLENDNDATISRNDVNIQFFWHYFVSLVKFSYWSKFCVNIITSSGIMTISFYKGLTRNLEIWNNHVWVLSNIWRLGQDRNTKFDRNVSNKIKVVYSIISFKRTQLCRTTKPHVICKKKQISKPLVQLSTVLDHLISSSHVVWFPLFDIALF